jgi:hypothetical protein
MFDVLFIHCLSFIVSGCYCLDGLLLDNLQDLQEQDFEQHGEQGK